VTLDQNRARVFGVLYLITFITSIPARLLYQRVLDDPVGYIASAGQYCTAKGFRPSSPMLRGDTREDRVTTPAVSPA
jgi:hypothetical protein